MRAEREQAPPGARTKKEQEPTRPPDGVVARSAEAQSTGSPTDVTAAEARTRVASATGTQQLRAQIERRLPARPPERPPEAERPSEPGPANPLGDKDRAAATKALKEEPRQSDRNPYVHQQNRIKQSLDRLGISRASSDRVHIDDVDRSHAAAVTRTAAGKTSLSTGSDVSTNTDGLPENFESKHLTADQRRRFDTFDQRVEATMSRNPGVDDLARIGTESLERSVVEKQLRLENIRDNTPNDGKKTFVNMSWGETPHEAAQNMAGAIMMAPKGSQLHDQATKLLGHAPSSQADYERVMRDMAYPALDRAMKSPDFQARMTAARQGLEGELARGREHGILAFQAAGNAFDDAKHFGKPSFSIGSTNGVKGLITVGAVDIGRGGDPSRERVAPFSSDGDIQVSAPGVNLPVGVRRGRAVPEEGTSFSSPSALSVAREMSAANPNLSVNDIAKLMTDPRAVHDIPGTKRDGAGSIDAFAAVLLAKNPNLTRAQIDTARSQLARRDADVARIRRELGL